MDSPNQLDNWLEDSPSVSTELDANLKYIMASILTDMLFQFPEP